MSEAPSVRESLQAALAANVETAPAPEPVQAATPAPDGDGGSKVIEAPTEAAPATGEAGQPRGPDGKFAPKNNDTPAPAGAEASATPTPPKEPETAKLEGGGAQAGPTRIPPSLSAAVKAQWDDLPAQVRDEFTRLEESFQKGKAEWGKKAERLNRFDEIMGPHADRLRMAGLDEFSGIQSLLAAQSLLDRDPLNGLLQVARSYGVSAHQLAQAAGLPQASQPQPGAEGQPAPTAAPELSAALQPLMQRFQTLEQQLQRSKQESEQAELAKAHAEVEAFAAKPENKYFENVRPAVAKLLEQGLAADLADAYQQAIWANPEIRPLLLADQAKQASAEAARRAKEEADRKKAATAQHAAGSVTGSPAPGATAPQVAQGTLRDQLRAAYQEVSGTV